MVKKKNVDEILKEMDWKYAYSLGRRDRAKKKSFDSFGENYHRGRISMIEDLYCNILGIDVLDKTGRSLIRHLRKKARKGKLYRSVKKKGYV
ncbi:MAG: hypothetical protein HFG91_06540 [Acholeplasmatales bacterium]|jgi:hypothetical protein|nr:hypothetical protein [Acholeplasmatales bacterium]